MSPICEPWTLDLECCELPEGDHDALIEKWQGVASEALWAASGRRIGTCPVTIRPCVRRCDGGMSGFPTPYKNDDGEWLNWPACGCRAACSCTALSEISIPGPVASITQVLIGEDELMPDLYRLDRVEGDWRLVYLDGEWPVCSDMTVACGEEGSFCITYEQGIELTELAIAAVSEATCELTKACIPGCKTCRLPKNVQSVVRRGVAISLDVTLGWIKSLPLVAEFLAVYNPKGLSSSPTVWSPDIEAPRITPVSSGS